MPLGASITYGSGSTHGNGYRDYLRNLLVADGYSVHMVGSVRAGIMENNDNEGWPGFRIDQVEPKGISSAYRFLPNLVVLNAGTNDCIQNRDVARAGNRTRRLLERLWLASPGSTILLSTLLVNDSKEGAEDRVLEFNEQMRYVAKQCEWEGKRIVLVDMHGGDGPGLEDLVDGTHPNDAGYEKWPSSGTGVSGGGVKGTWRAWRSSESRRWGSSRPPRCLPS
ncbi:unnamed protein product [Parascedosporium putredinis]|uniref:SGNH hydrolase-type esterase domain-containing protein n=1 Tax=Parascedosporium putredinis TaxID=1442378 RepID=A0A9P1MB95_9PEZI|nr:unnamed protein product [Parascedosporium putredinis]CAI7994217.1 unnamed protein product [Parascedosporium putredinis]